MWERVTCGKPCVARRIEREFAQATILVEPEADRFDRIRRVDRLAASFPVLDQRGKDFQSIPFDRSLAGHHQGAGRANSGGVPSTTPALRIFAQPLRQQELSAEAIRDGLDTTVSPRPRADRAVDSTHPSAK